MIIFIMKRCDHFSKNSNGIGNGATINTTMQITVWSCYFYFNIT